MQETEGRLQSDSLASHSMMDALLVPAVPLIVNLHYSVASCSGFMQATEQHLHLAY